MNRTHHVTSRARRGLGRLALTGALALGTSGVAFALPTQETTATPPAKTAPGTPPTTAAPAAETPTPPPRAPVDRAGRDPRGMPTPAAPSGSNLPPSPGAVLSERDVAGRAEAAPTTTLSARDAKKAEKIVRELHKTNELEVTLASLARERASSEAVKSYAKELVDTHQAADKKVLAYAQTHGVAAGLSALPGMPSEATVAPTTGAAAVPAPAGAATGQVNSNRVASAGNTAVNAGTPTGTTSPTGHGTGLPTPNAPTITGNTTRAADPNAGRAVPAPSDAMAMPAPTLDAEGRRHLAKLEKLEGAAFDKQFLTMMVQGHSKALAKMKAFSKDKALDTELSSLLSETQTMVEGHLTKAKELQRAGTSSLPTPDKTLGALQPR
ncbi:MAG TPA: DUF4142 domain-containing protein [Polyangia bacterium]